MKYRFRLAPVAPDAWKFIAVFLVFGVPLLLVSWFGQVIGALLLVAAGFTFYFFRDGEREIPKTDDLLSPADGTVMEISDVDGEGYGRGRVVRIFLSVLDGHVQRAPTVGKVTSVNYAPGLFLDARDERAPFANESNAIEILTPRGRIMVKQIAGLIARRIVCWVRPDDSLSAGERIGLIRFGSQVDLYIPLEATVTVREGDRVVGGQTVLARWPEHAVTTETPALSAAGVR